MKNVISKFFDFIFKDSLWKSIVFGAVLILVGGGLYYILNFSSKGRPDFIITAKEFKKNKYPIISHTDPVSRFYGWTTGDVIQITRKDNFIMYRIVGK